MPFPWVTTSECGYGIGVDSVPTSPTLPLSKEASSNRCWDLGVDLILVCPSSAQTGPVLHGPLHREGKKDIYLFIFILLLLLFGCDIFKGGVVPAGL